MRPPAAPLAVSPPERAILEAMLASDEIPREVKKRARVVLRAADGASNCTIGREAEIARPRVVFWRRRFEEQGVRGLWDVEGAVTKEKIPEEAEKGILRDCLYLPRMSGRAAAAQLLVDPSVNWNVNNLARRHRVSPSAVHRVWQKYGIHMRRWHGGDIGVDLSKLKISQDPLFGLSIYAIGGLFFEAMGPALALCSRDRPFRELQFWDGSQEARQAIVDDLVSRLPRLEGRPLWGLKPSIDRFVLFLRTVLDKHPGAQIHLLLEGHGHEMYCREPPLALIAKHPCIQLHYVPWQAGERGWSAWVERWLRVVAEWPMQESFVQTAFAVREALRQAALSKRLDTIVIV